MAFILLIVYSIAIFSASLFGVWLSRRFHMTHIRTQLAMSLVAGLMLGVAFFHLIPHSMQGVTMTPAIITLEINRLGNIDFTMGWTVAGLVFMLLLLRLFRFHQQ